MHGLFLLMMVVIDEKYKNQIFYFPTKKSQPTKVSIREAIWNFPPQLHRVQRFEMWSIECEEESLAVCVKILFSGPLLRAKFTATLWIFYVFSFPVLQRCFGEMEWRKVSRKKLWKASHLVIPIIPPEWGPASLKGQYWQQWYQSKASWRGICQSSWLRFPNTIFLLT